MRREFMALAGPLLALFLAVPAASESTVPGALAEITLSFAPVVRQATPAVVNIYATVLVADHSSPFAGDPFFEQFFKDFGPTTPRLQNSLGSGVIVSPDGVVVSNYHVVAQATEIRVELADRREFQAHVLLADPDSDLAVLQLEGATDLPALALRDSDEVEVGELVLAIGDPFGVGQTVSMGIVSGLARSAQSVGDGRGYFIQTDAAINPGNSGGALVDGSGRLVGINTAILTQSGGSNGIGFAIPANLVRSFVDQARAGQTRFQRPWAGISGQTMDAAMAEAMGLDRPEGVVLTELHPLSPFRAAGMVAGDVLLSLGGKPADTPQEVMFRLAALGVGKAVTVGWRHDGAMQEAEISLGLPPDEPPRDTVMVQGNSVLRGLTVARINPAVVAELDLRGAAEGVAVLAAEDLAAEVGLQAGDILIAINDLAISVPDDVKTALEGPYPRRWQIVVQRGDQVLQLRFRV